MTICWGDNFNISIEINGKSEIVEGVYNSSFTLNNQFTKSNAISENLFQKLDKIKYTHLTFSISGIYTASVAEEKIRYLAFTGKVGKYQLSFGNDDYIVTKLLITSYERSGNEDSEERYNVNFESSGEIVYIN